jgi:hypothetical protein
LAFIRQTLLAFFHAGSLDSLVEVFELLETANRSETAGRKATGPHADMFARVAGPPKGPVDVYPASWPFMAVGSQGGRDSGAHASGHSRIGGEYRFLS